MVRSGEPQGEGAGGGPVALHVLTRLVLGGPSRPALCWLDRLARSGFRTVLAVGRPADYEAECDDALRFCPDLSVLKLTSLVRRPSPANDARSFATLSAAVRKLMPVVVHTHTAKAGALGRLAARTVRRRPVIVHTFHGHSLRAAASGRGAPLWRAVERALASTADLLLAVSPVQRDELARLLGPRAARRLAVLPLAFDPGMYGAEDPTEEYRFRQQASRPGARTLVFVGRGVAVKGLDHLARACRRLAAINPAAARRLRVVVVGPVMPSVRADVEQTLGNPEGGVRWLFWGTSRNPLPLIAAADALVLPSLSEGTPVGVLEALWAGQRVIASAVGGVPELLGCTWVREGAGVWRTAPGVRRGTLLPPADTDSWSAALAEFASGSEIVPGDPRERRHFVRETFDPAARGAELLDLYARCGVHAPPIRRADRTGGRPVRAASPVFDEPRIRPSRGSTPPDAGTP